GQDPFLVIVLEDRKVRGPVEAHGGLDVARCAGVLRALEAVLGPGHGQQRARCPPADVPIAPMRSGSMWCSFACRRSQRTADLASSTGAGNGAPGIVR